jgi:hypothetical protein
MEGGATRHSQGSWAAPASGAEDEGLRTLAESAAAARSWVVRAAHIAHGTSRPSPHLRVTSHHTPHTTHHITPLAPPEGRCSARSAAPCDPASPPAGGQIGGQSRQRGTRVVTRARPLAGQPAHGPSPVRPRQERHTPTLHAVSPAHGSHTWKSLGSKPSLGSAHSTSCACCPLSRSLCCTAL